jgi:methyl-accepting chemotaxis protein
MSRPFFAARPAAAAPAPHAPAGDASTAPRVLAEIGAGRQRVHARIEALQSLTEREVLACGRVLSSIVDNVRRLIEDTDRSVAATLADSDAATTRFIAEMQGDIQAQEAAVGNVLSLADGMQEAIEAINGLSHYSNILSMNARIEAARIGHHGAGFAVIADHTRELSKTLREAAERVGKAIEAVRAGLPPVTERATAMQGRTQSFIGVVSEQMKSASRQAAASRAGDRGLEEVVSLSNEALSHLQFHDTLTHGLDGIEGDVGAVESRVRRVLDGETQLEALPQDAAPAAAPAPGKITLF